MYSYNTLPLLLIDTVLNHPSIMDAKSNCTYSLFQLFACTIIKITFNISAAVIVDSFSNTKYLLDLGDITDTLTSKVRWQLE